MSSAAFKATSIRNMATITGKVKWFNVAKVRGWWDLVCRCRRNVVVHPVVWLCSRRASVSSHPSTSPRMVRVFPIVRFIILPFNVCVCVWCAVFVHQSNINSTGFRFLREGEEVSYEPISTDRGTTATKVSKPDGSPIVRAEGERA